MTQTQTVTEDDFFVSLTFHNFSAAMLKEFALKIVKPYFGGNVNEAIRNLVQKAIAEENLFKNAAIKSSTRF